MRWPMSREVARNGASSLNQIKSAIEINSLDIKSCALLTSRHPHKTAVEIAAEFSLERECDYYKRSATMAHEKRTKGLSSLETN